MQLALRGEKKQIVDKVFKTCTHFEMKLKVHNHNRFDVCVVSDQPFQGRRVVDQTLTG